MGKAGLVPAFFVNRSLTHSEWLLPDKFSPWPSGEGILFVQPPSNSAGRIELSLPFCFQHAKIAQIRWIFPILLTGQRDTAARNSSDEKANTRQETWRYHPPSAIPRASVS
jgi:hypothetical protein